MKALFFFYFLILVLCFYISTHSLLTTDKITQNTYHGMYIPSYVNSVIKIDDEVYCEVNQTDSEYNCLCAFNNKSIYHINILLLSVYQTDICNCKYSLLCDKDVKEREVYFLVKKEENEYTVLSIDLNEKKIINRSKVKQKMHKNIILNVIDNKIISLLSYNNDINGDYINITLPIENKSYLRLLNTIQSDELCINSIKRYNPLDESLTCLSCKSINKFYCGDETECCDECPLNMISNDENICLYCSGDTSYYDHRCLHQCPEGYESIDNVCIHCKENVINKYYDQTNKTCVSQCEDEYVPDENNICKHCDKYILDNKCIDKCDIGYIIDTDNKHCIACDEKYYDVETSLCVDHCDNLVAKIINKDIYICTSCQKYNSTYFDSITKKCITSPNADIYSIDTIHFIATPCYLKGEYLDENKCVEQCSPYSSITQYNKCTLCKSINKYYENNECVDECDEGYEADTDNMICTKCKAYYDKENKKCVNICPSGYIGDSNFNCVKCENDLYVYGNQCVPKSSCDLSKYIDDYSKVCSHCEDENKYYMENTCQEGCPNEKGVVIDSNQKICYRCSERNMITNSLYKVGISTNSIVCYSQCPSNCIYDAENNECKCCQDNSEYYNKHTNQCSSNCDSSSYAINAIEKTCEMCNDTNKYLYNNNCVEQCPYGYGAYQGNCIKCNEQGLYLYNHKCVTSCPSNSMEENNECIKCSEKGLFYDINSKKCLHKCNMFSIVNKLGKTCSSCDSQNKIYFTNLNICMDNCAFTSSYQGKICSFDNKCDVLGKKLNPYDNECYADCPKGLIVSGSMCIKCTDISTTDIYYDEGVCVDKCPSGTVLNKENDNFICEHCVYLYNNECYSQSPIYKEVTTVDDYQFCEKCDTGYSIEQDKCVNQCETISDGVCETKCYDKMCLHGSCNNNECLCESNYEGKYCQLLYLTTSPSYYIRFNKNDVVNYSTKNEVYLYDKNNELVSNVYWTLYINTVDKKEGGFMNARNSNPILISPLDLSLKNNTIKATINNETVSMMFIPFSFHGNTDDYDIVFNIGKSIVITSNRNDLQLNKFKFYFGKDKSIMIPLTSSYSYQNEYKGYLPSMEKIIVGIKDRNNEVHYIEKNVNYDSRKYIDKLEEKNITHVIDNLLSLTFKEKMNFLIVYYDEFNHNSYDNTNCFNYIKTKLKRDNKENALILIQKIIKEKNNRSKILRCLGEEYDTVIKDTIELLKLMIAELSIEDNVKDIIHLLYQTINQLLSILHSKDVFNDILNLLYSLSIKLNEMMNIVPDEKVSIISSNFEVYLYHLNENAIKDIIISQSSIDENNKDEINTVDIENIINTETIIKESFKFSMENLQHLNNIDLLLYQQTILSESISLNDILFLFVKLKSSSVPYISSYTSSLLSSSFSISSFYHIPSSSFITEEYDKIFVFKASSLDSYKTIACVNIDNPSSMICTTHFNYTSNEIICKCNSNGEEQLKIFPIDNETLATLNIAYQYPKSESVLFHPYIMSITYTILAFTIIFSIYLLFIDRCEDEENLIKNKSLTHLNKFGDLTTLIKADSFSLSIKLTLYFYPLFQIFHTYHYNQPRFHRLLYYVIRYIFSFILSSIPFIILDFTYGDEYEYKRDIDITYTHLPYRTIDISISFISSVVSFYIIGVLMFYISKFCSFDYYVVNIWEKIYNDITKLNISKNDLYSIKVKLKRIAMRLRAIARIESPYTEHKFEKKKDTFTNYLELKKINKHYIESRNKSMKYKNKQQTEDDVLFLENQTSFSLNLSEQDEEIVLKGPKISINEDEETNNQIKYVFFKYIKTSLNNNKDNQYVFMKKNKKNQVYKYRNSSIELTHHNILTVFKKNQKRKFRHLNSFEGEILIIVRLRNYTYISKEYNRIMERQFRKEKESLIHFVIGSIVLFIFLIGGLALLSFIIGILIKKYKYYLFAIYIWPFCFVLLFIDIVVNYIYNLIVSIRFIRDYTMIGSKWLGNEYVYFFKTRLYLIRNWKRINYILK